MKGLQKQKLARSTTLGRLSHWDGDCPSSCQSFQLSIYVGVLRY